MRVRHRVTGTAGTIHASKPITVMDEPHWYVQWDHFSLYNVVSDDDLIFLD